MLGISHGSTVEKRVPPWRKVRELAELSRADHSPQRTPAEDSRPHRAADRLPLNTSAETPLPHLTLLNRIQRVAPVCCLRSPYPTFKAGRLTQGRFYRVAEEPEPWGFPQRGRSSLGAAPVRCGLTAAVWCLALGPPGEGREPPARLGSGMGRERRG